MNLHKPEWISALADGELHGLRRWLVRRHAARCPLCAAEYRRVKHVSILLAGNPPGVEMSDSQEFFWSKVRAEIQRRGNQQVESPFARLSLPDWFRRYQTALATAVAAAIFGLGLLWLVQVRHATRMARNAPSSVLAKVEDVVTPIPNTVATVLQTGDDHVAVIWISGLPWAENMTEMRILFDELEET